MLYVDGLLIGDMGSVSTWIISHDHSDVYIPRHHTVLASDIVANVVGLPNVQPTFAYSGLPRWTYIPRVGNILVFPTAHCCGSIGFYFPVFGSLFLGDGRITPFIKALLSYLTVSNYRIDTCYYDNLMVDKGIDRFPTILESTTSLLTLCRAHNEPFLISKPHTGIIEAIRKDTSLRISFVHASDRQTLQALVPPHRLCDRWQSSHLVVTFRQPPKWGLVHLKMSALYFFFENSDHVEPPTPVWDEDRQSVRLFLSTHASPMETTWLMTTLGKSVSFSGTTRRHTEFREHVRSGNAPNMPM
jgi:hypothetical protein